MFSYRIMADRAVAVFKVRVATVTGMDVTKEGDDSVQLLDAAWVESTQQMLEGQFKLAEQYFNNAIAHVDITDELQRECVEMHGVMQAAFLRGLAALTARRQALLPQQEAQPQNMANPEQIIRIVNKRDPRVNKFNGEPHAWPAFRDMFMAEVHNREDIETVTKLTYLKTSCIGAAADVLGHWGHTADSYAGAWKLLNERYEDSYNIKQSLVAQIMSIPAIKTESHENLSSVVNTVESVLRQLKDMKVKVKYWDPVIIYTIMTRLPYRAKADWEQRREANVEPSLDQLLQFLSNRARGRLCSDTPSSAPKTESNANAQRQNGDRTKAQVPATPKSPPQVKVEKRPHAADSNNKFARKLKLDKPASSGNRENKAGASSRFKVDCYLCKGDHPLYRCSKFKSTTLNKKIQLVDQMHLCRNCLKKHGPGECKFSGCPRCGEKHNLLLCPVAVAQVSALLEQNQGASNSN